MSDRINRRIWGWLHAWQSAQHLRSGILHAAASVAFQAAVRPDPAPGPDGDEYLSKYHQMIASITRHESKQAHILGLFQAADSIVHIALAQRSFGAWLNGENVIADLGWWAVRNWRRIPRRLHWPKGLKGASK